MEEHRIEYSDPKDYDERHGGKTRTAMNVTNLVTLEERIRKASGIATTEQLIRIVIWKREKLICIYFLFLFVRSRNASYFLSGTIFQIRMSK